MTDFETSTDFIRLQKAIKSTMITIASSLYDRTTYIADFKDKKLADQIDNDVDVAFSVISDMFENITCICDTVTRRCAKSEIHSVVHSCIQLRLENDKFDSFQYIEDHIDCESVFEDIIDMNTDNDD